MMNSVVFQLKHLLLVTVTGAAILVSGCKDHSIRVYSIPKETPKPDRQMAEAPARGTPHLHWDELPPTWTELPASSMRAASFRVTGPDGLEGDVGAIPLPRMAGRELEFVNMWRADLELAESTTNAIAEIREDALIAGVPGSLFEMVSEKALVDDQFKKRVVAAMMTTDTSTWFFKLTGPDQLVTAEKQNFVDWLRNVEIDLDSHGATAPQMSTTSGSTTLPEWTIPAGWTPQQPGPMLLAAFALPGGDAQVTVSSLGGDGGGLLPNINRWRGQLGLPSIDSNQLGEVVQSIQTAEGQGTLVDLQGSEQRLLAVIIPHGDRSWFYKSMGPTEVVTQERDAFVQFAQTAKH